MSQTPDIIVVGLGIAGLSTVYRLSKIGYKVWAFQQFSSSGSIGTSSAGYTRIFRVSSIDQQLMKHAFEDLKVWRQLEAMYNKKILHLVGGLNIGPKNHHQILQLKENLQTIDLPKDSYKQYSSQQLAEKYPSLKIPPDFIGIEQSKTMGFLDVKVALWCLKQAATKFGANLFYSTRVTKIDLKQKRIEAINSQHLTKKISYKQSLVMTTGPYTPNFKTQDQVERIETQTIRLNDPKDIPTVCILYSDIHFYLLPYSPQMKAAKIGTHVKRSFSDVIEVIRQYMPSKLDCMDETQPCFYTMRSLGQGLQIYREGDVVWCYGFNGSGFKHAPSIGIKVATLVSGMSDCQITPKL